MCQYYATLLGGSISVKSQLGQGTTLQLVLPCNEVSQTPWQPASETAEDFLVPLKSSDLKSRILLVDDEEEVLEYVAELLGHHYEIFKATNIQQAFKLLKTQEIDLVISDQVMNEGSGMELLALIRTTVPMRLRTRSLPRHGSPMTPREMWNPRRCVVMSIH